MRELNPEWQKTYAIKCIKDIKQSALYYVTGDTMTDPLDVTRFRAKSHLMNEWWGRADFVDADHASRAVGMASEFLNKNE